MHNNQPKWDTEYFIKKAKSIHGDKFDYSKSVFVNTRTKVIVICNTCGYEWQAHPSKHCKGSGCHKCNHKKLPQNQKMSHERFIKKAKSIHGNKFSYLTRYKGIHEKITLKCNKCKRVFKTKASTHIHNNSNCMACAAREACKKISRIRNKPMPVERFEERCNKVHNNKYEYFQDFIGIEKKIKILCKKHQEYFYQCAANHLHSAQGCPKCGLSKGELRIDQYLSINKLNYTRQQMFNDCKDKRRLKFDFYLPKYNCCIEYDGQQHFYSKESYGGEERFLEIKKRDAIKDKYCQDNNIRLIRIPYYEYNNIEEILNKALLATGSI